MWRETVKLKNILILMSMDSRMKKKRKENIFFSFGMAIMKKIGTQWARLMPSISNGSLFCLIIFHSFLVSLPHLSTMQTSIRLVTTRNRWDMWNKYRKTKSTHSFIKLEYNVVRSQNIQRFYLVFLFIEFVLCQHFHVHTRAHTSI